MRFVVTIEPEDGDKELPYKDLVEVLLKRVCRLEQYVLSPPNVLDDDDDEDRNVASISI